MSYPVVNVLCPQVYYLNDHCQICDILCDQFDISYDQLFIIYMVNLTFIWSFSLINWVDNVNWPPSIVSKLTLRALALRQSDWRNYGFSVCLPYLLDLNATLESSWFSRNVAWCLQVKHALAREISLLIWAIHSAFFNFCFAINMATLNDAFHAIEQKRLLFRP